MSLPSCARSDDRDPLHRADLGDAGSLREVLKPVIAGARARGVADGLEMLGVGAVLIDATGGVLHVGDRARQMMIGWAKVVESHFVAERPCDSRAVQDLVSSAIGIEAYDPDRRIHVAARSSDSGVSLRALRFHTDEGFAQRLHAVLVLEPA